MEKLIDLTVAIVAIQFIGFFFLLGFLFTIVSKLKEISGTLSNMSTNVEEIPNILHILEDSKLLNTQ